MDWCCELYPQIYKVENLMRKLILQFMLTKLGVGWQTMAIPNNVTETIKQKGNNKTSNIIYELDFVHLSSFLFTPYTKKSITELPEVINKLKSDPTRASQNIDTLNEFIPVDNWTRYFSEILDCESKQLEKKWKQLYEIRCKVAHNNILNFDEYNNGKSLCEYLEKILENSIIKLKDIFVPDEDIDSVSTRTISAVENVYQNELIGKSSKISSTQFTDLLQNNCIESISGMTAALKAAASLSMRQLGLESISGMSEALKAANSLSMRQLCLESISGVGEALKAASLSMRQLGLESISGMSEALKAANSFNINQPKLSSKPNIISLSENDIPKKTSIDEANDQTITESDKTDNSIENKSEESNNDRDKEST